MHSRREEDDSYNQNYSLDVRIGGTTNRTVNAKPLLSQYLLIGDPTVDSCDNNSYECGDNSNIAAIVPSSALHPSKLPSTFVRRELNEECITDKIIPPRYLKKPVLPQQVRQARGDRNSDWSNKPSRQINPMKPFVKKVSFKDTSDNGDISKTLPDVDAKT